MTRTRPAKGTRTDPSFPGVSLVGREKFLQLDATPSSFHGLRSPSTPTRLRRSSTSDWLMHHGYTRRGVVCQSRPRAGNRRAPSSRSGNPKFKDAAWAELCALRASVCPLGATMRGASPRRRAPAEERKKLSLDAKLGYSGALNLGARLGFVAGLEPRRRSADLVDELRSMRPESRRAHPTKRPKLLGKRGLANVLPSRQAERTQVRTSYYE